jgi:lysophospholipase L1-like esterase
MINAPVINLGQSGITTSSGVNRLQRVLAHEPQVVIIELGGHDFLREESRASTKANLQELIDECRKAGAEVVLFEIPRGFIIDRFRGLERELAYENDLELVPDAVIRNLVIWSPATPLGVRWKNSRLSDDGIHSNSKGSQFMAAAVADSLQRMYGERTVNVSAP